MTIPKELKEMTFEDFCRTVFNPKKRHEKPEVLKGKRGISTTQYILGPSCAAYLAELGAETIKVELPRRGEPMRHTTPFNEPFLYPLSRWMPDKGTGLGFFGANHNEYFITLDFHKPEAIEIMKRLAAKSDFMAENYRAGTFDRWGIGYRQLSEVNPRLIYQWMGGFGGWGPGRNRASYDILGQAQGGCFSVTGLQREFGGLPSKHTIWIMDYWGGAMSAFQILANMWWRDNISGLGNFMEYSQVHGAQRHLSDIIALYGRYGLVAQRWGNWDVLLCVHGIVQCGKSSYPGSKNPQEQEEGYCLISAYEDEDYAALCNMIERHDLAEKYPEHKDRLDPEAQFEIYAAIEEWAADKTKEEVAAICDQYGLIAQPVMNSKEVSTNPHWQERGTLQWIDDPTFGDVFAQVGGYLMSDTPPRCNWVFKPVGADNDYILAKLCGFTGSEIAKLEAEEVI
ncbi:MAG: CoA transferase [Deltaproteobacteria bacterium]|nr:MAG: CoA transferase [Deltaproteobacteria bacterium]